MSTVQRRLIRTHNVVGDGMACDTALWCIKRRCIDTELEHAEIGDQFFSWGDGEGSNATPPTRFLYPKKSRACMFTSQIKQISDGVGKKTKNAARIDARWCINFGYVIYVYPT